MLPNFAKVMFPILDKSEKYYIMLFTIFDNTRNILTKKWYQPLFVVTQHIFKHVHNIWVFVHWRCFHTCLRVQYILLHSNGPLVHKIASMSLMCQQQNFLPSFCKIQWPCSCKYHHKIVFSVQILVDVPVFNVHKPISENKS